MWSFLFDCSLGSPSHNSGSLERNFNASRHPDSSIKTVDAGAFKLVAIGSAVASSCFEIAFCCFWGLVKREVMIGKEKSLILRVIKHKKLFKLLHKILVRFLWL